jgi:hypothetical protein
LTTKTHSYRQIVAAGLLVGVKDDRIECLGEADLAGSASRLSDHAGQSSVEAAFILGVQPYLRAPLQRHNRTDNNGDGDFSDRPGITDARNPNAVATQFGALEPTVINGSLGRNAGGNPLNASLDLSVSRSFRLGHAAGQRPALAADCEHSREQSQGSYRTEQVH